MVNPKPKKKRRAHTKTVTPRMLRANRKNAQKAALSHEREYDPKCCKLVKYAAFNGAKDADLARMLNVHQSTIIRWKEQYPEFAQAIIEGREEVLPQVTRALVRRAIGYSHKAVKIHVNAQGQVTQVPYIERYAPDTAAAIAILERRGGDQWAPPALRHKIGGDPENPTPVGVIIVPAKAP